MNISYVPSIKKLLSQTLIETMELTRIIQFANLSAIKTNIKCLWTLPKLLLPCDVSVPALMPHTSMVYDQYYQRPIEKNTTIKRLSPVKNDANSSNYFEKDFNPQIKNKEHFCIG